MERNLNEDLKISKLHLDDAAESQGEKERYYGDAVADDQSLFADSPKLFAGYHVFHRL